MDETLFIEVIILDIAGECIDCQLFDGAGKRIFQAAIMKSEIVKCFDLASWEESRYRKVEPAKGLRVILELNEACMDRLGIFP